MSVSPRPRVLLVDDEPAPRRAIARLLEVRLGVETLETAGAMEALTAWRREGRIAAAVIDVEMPEMGGLELLTRFAKLAPDLPIIVWTGSPLDVSDPRLKHAAAVLTKGADMDRLVESVGMVLGIHNSRPVSKGPAAAARASGDDQE